MQPTTSPTDIDATIVRPAARRWTRNSPIVFAAVAAAAALAGAWPAAALAATEPNLGTAANYTVLAGSAVTNTGSSVITGNLGIDPNGSTSVTGFPPGTVSGTQDLADANAVQAQTDLATGYNDAASATSNDSLSGTDLGGLTLTPGVYTFSSSAQLTGTLTLSGNGVFIFQIGSTLTTASSSDVSLVNGAQACAVYWQVGSSATLGSGTQFQGNLMALTSITMVTGTDDIGRALARNGAVTLDTNDITAPSGTCTVTDTTYTPPVGGGGSGPTGGSATTPDTGAAASSPVIAGLLLVLVGGLICAVAIRRHAVARR
jgi:hypothetical protein